MTEGKTILIIEDEMVLGEVLLNKFRQEGYDAHWEKDGETGIQQMRALMPDLVLLDIMMPKKDGYEVLQDMQKDPHLKGIPVVVVSNSGQPVEIQRILDLGARDYIVKAQFSPEEVLAKVKKHIRGAPAAEKTAPAEKRGTGIKVLVVEDDPFLSSLLKGRLEKDGYQVTAALDGALGLAALSASKPDLVLLDIIMPVMNGFDMLKKMKADPAMKDVIVIIFSNLGQEHEIEEGKQLGADDFLVKAKFTLHEVMTKIEDLLKRKGKM
jgi:DNA-binding response OmpR family regulator